MKLLAELPACPVAINTNTISIACERDWTWSLPLTISMWVMWPVCLQRYLTTTLWHVPSTHTTSMWLINRHLFLRQIRPFRKLDMSVLTNKLTDALSEKLERPPTSDCSTQLDDYCETLTKVLDKLAPLKSCKPKKKMSCKWNTDETHLMRQLRGKNKSIWRKSGLEVHRMIYINHINEVNQAIQKAKCDYYTTLLEKADVKVLSAQWIDFWPLWKFRFFLLTKSTVFVLLWTVYLLPTLTWTRTRILNILQQPHLTTVKKRVKQKLEK